MLPSLISRNVVVSGQRTSFRLEPEMWAALDLICNQEETDLHTLCTWISLYKPRSNRTSAIRAFIVSYLRAKADGVLDKVSQHPASCQCSAPEEMSAKLCHLFGDAN